MIKEIIAHPKKENQYGRFFLSMEAPDDEEQPAVKANTKVINVKPNNRRRLDFTDGAIDDTPEMDETEEPMPDDQDYASASDVDMGDGVDYTQVGDQPENDIRDNTTPAVVDNGDGMTQPDASSSEDFNQEPAVDDGGTELSTDADDEPTIDDSTDFTSDADTGTDDSAADATGDAGATDQSQPSGPGLEYDSTRKYTLFLDYEGLVIALENYSTKLENNLGDDLNKNRILKVGIEKLREIRDLCYEYMIMKFESVSYVQSLLFYQRAVIMTQKVFELLNKYKKYLKKEVEY